MTTERNPPASKMHLNLMSRTLTPRRAARLITATTLFVTALGGILMWLLDHKEFPALGTSLWWSIQTVTTVGYGDVVPHSTGGRFIGAVVMLQGIAFITVVAASVTAALIEQARQRRAQTADTELRDREMSDAGVMARLTQIDARLGAIEDALAKFQRAATARPGPPGEGAGGDVPPKPV
jgi:voltage-gated potassium channel